MGLDIRLPMGLMFSILGALLVVYGLLSDQQIYQEHSLGINVNLEWGIVVLAFGLIMLIMGRRGSAAMRDGNKAAENRPGKNKSGAAPQRT